MLVIFDCDGVLVDSEPLAAKIFSEVLTKEVLENMGLEFSPEECFYQFHGKTLDACYSWIENYFKVTLPDGFDEVLKAETQKRFSQELKPVKGIENVLHGLKIKNIPFCVASNGGHKKIFHSLATTNLNDLVVNRFSVDDVEEGKPAPDLFLYAAKKMGFNPEECVVVEDSDSGVTAAIRANIRVLKYHPRVFESQKSQGNLAESENLGVRSSTVECFENMKDLLVLLSLE